MLLHLRQCIVYSMNIANVSIKVIIATVQNSLLISIYYHLKFISLKGFSNHIIVALRNEKIKTHHN